MPGILIEDVSRSFDSVVAVQGVSLEIAESEFVTLLGPSGCGKTTTLRMVAGLEHNDAGRISIGDRIVSDPARRVFVQPEQRKIGMVFQSYAIWPHMTVFDNVAYPLRIRRRGAAEIREKVDVALRLVEMEAYADRPAPRLSGGQQQRVAIARALVFQPEVLLLDEPLSNLDAKLRAQTGDEFRSLQKRLGITTLYVTHDQEEAMALSDRIVVMQSGKVLQVGAPEDIYRHPSSRDVAAFFGSPNLLEAVVLQVRASEDGFARVEVDGEGWTGVCRAGPGLSQGDRVLVMIRPEIAGLVKVTSDAAPRTDERHVVWRGRVIETVFRGPRRSVTADVAGKRFNIEAPSVQHVSPGDEVAIVVAPDAAWAIPA